MYSEDDLDAAVQAGVLSADNAKGFRNFVAARTHTPAVDEEHFRLVTGFNDIFVSIALVLVLAALGSLGGKFIHVSAGAFAVAAASWPLAEYFTRRRRMALPSIILLLSFVGGVFATGLGVLELFGFSLVEQRSTAAPVAVVALVSALAAYGHWRRFRVPITVAAGAAAIIGGLLLTVKLAWPGLDLAPFSGLTGLGVFALAMAWDMSDGERITRRADVAFWLHLIAAPLIVHPVFSLLGLLGNDGVSTARAMIALGVYLLLALVALAIDRRALLVSALVYVLYAMSALIQGAGAVTESFALTGLLIGSGLLLLSAAWHRARRPVLALLPIPLRSRLPAA